MSCQIFIQSPVDIYIYIILYSRIAGDCPYLFKAVTALKYFWYRPGPGHIISLTVTYNFIILHFDNSLRCL